MLTNYVFNIILCRAFILDVCAYINERQINICLFSDRIRYCNILLPIDNVCLDNATNINNIDSFTIIILILLVHTVLYYTPISSVLHLSASSRNVTESVTCYTQFKVESGHNSFHKRYPFKCILLRCM